ncbi:WhiB family transcriptional regulator [Actinokineospora spheciospongiae]|uniref:WhiB family transcriptional regulator n=1 Tax=Actinokineospora spheciospongiae TaxID=909613 RepID=UPI000D70B957|nr:WhiB family transcriptional regulator [Actinokineospora spheciospongiae]PWW50250.1 transcription factor WhiB [Actinokineospora spheciospongiae]
MIDLTTGACASSETPELWYGLSEADTAAARATCHRCPIIFACTAHAIADETFEPYGVWGGLTEDDRRATRQPRHPGRVRVARPRATLVDDIASGRIAELCLRGHPRTEATSRPRAGGSGWVCRPCENQTARESKRRRRARGRVADIPGRTG